jgi:hypothetical protein
MAQAVVFDFKKSGLEPFLFAEVGTEPSGLGLTVLSVLARLDFDPWAEAARLVELPRKTSIERLARYIARMPVDQKSLVEAPATAERLTALLPVQTDAAESNDVPSLDMEGFPKWLPMVLLYCALVLGMGANAVMTPRPATTASAHVAQIVHQSGGSATPPPAAK